MTGRPGLLLQFARPGEVLTLYTAGDHLVLRGTVARSQGSELTNWYDLEGREIRQPRDYAALRSGLPAQLPAARLGLRLLPQVPPLSEAQEEVLLAIHSTRGAGFQLPQEVRARVGARKSLRSLYRKGLVRGMKPPVRLTIWGRDVAVLLAEERAAPRRRRRPEASAPVAPLRELLRATRRSA